MGLSKLQKEALLKANRLDHISEEMILPSGEYLKGTSRLNEGILIRIEKPLHIRPGKGERLDIPFILLATGKSPLALALRQLGIERFARFRAFENASDFFAWIKFNDLQTPTGRGGRMTTPRHALNLNTLAYASISPSEKARASKLLGKPGEALNRQRLPEF